MNRGTLAIVGLLAIALYCSGENVEGGHHKIDLEDIERDNILSERRARAKDALQTEQTQHLRPPGIQAHSEYHEVSESGTSRPSGVSYSINPSVLISHESTVTHMHPVEHHQEVYDDEEPEQPTEKYPSPKVVLQSVPAVHESTLTYVTPSRQSLGQGKVSSYSDQKYYVEQQPNQQYVYIQPKNQFRNLHTSPKPRYLPVTESQPETEPAYVYTHPMHTQQNSPESYETQADSVSEEERHHADDEVYQQPKQQRQQPSSASYLQYIPYIAPGPTQEQNYVMMVPIPAGYSRNIKPSSGEYSSEAPSTTSHEPSVQYVTPTRRPSIHYVNSNDIQGSAEVRGQAVSSQYYLHSQNHDEPGDIQYADPNQYRDNSERSKQLQYAPIHPEVSHQQPEQEKLHYLPPPQQPARQYLPLAPPSPRPSTGYLPPTSHISPPSIDFFKNYNRQAKSLLDSYIPSWVILQRQRALLQQYPQYYSPSIESYNTIAYSAPPPHRLSHAYIGSNHLKRSAKPKV